MRDVLIKFLFDMTAWLREQSPLGGRISPHARDGEREGCKPLGPTPVGRSQSRSAGQAPGILFRINLTGVR